MSDVGVATMPMNTVGFVSEDEVTRLRKENDLLRTQQAERKSQTESGMEKLVHEVLGNRFEWRILGEIGKEMLEIEVPEDLADPSVVERDSQGNIVWQLKFEKGHPKAGQPRGDVRSVRIKDVTQVRNYLLLVKGEIIRRFTKEGKSVPSFNA